MTSQTEKERCCGVFYALYGHVDSFGIVRSGVDRGEPLTDGSSDTVYAS